MINFQFLKGPTNKIYFLQRVLIPFQLLNMFSNEVIFHNMTLILKKISGTKKIQYLKLNLITMYFQDFYMLNEFL